MDGKALLAITLCAFATNVLATEQPRDTKDQSYFSSAETTYIWKHLGIRLIATHGQVGEGPAYRGSWEQQSFREKDGLRVILHAATFDKIDGSRIAALAQDALHTVARIAGKPPVRKIELYLVPPGTSYAVSHRSWAIGPFHSVTYAISSLDEGYELSVSRTVAHELFHTWVGMDQRSQMDNELGAATIENRAELDAFGYAVLLDKSPADATNVDRLAGVSPAARFTLATRYAADPELDNLLVDGKIVHGTANADALMKLCGNRAQRAIAIGHRDSTPL